MQSPPHRLAEPLKSPNRTVVRVIGRAGRGAKVDGRITIAGDRSIDAPKILAWCVGQSILDLRAAFAYHAVTIGMN
jgi:hypothetical protein